MNKTLVFDMDGTLCDTYNQENWLERLRSFDPSVYSNAEPIVSMQELDDTIQQLKRNGWKIEIVSWLSKGSTKEFDRAVRQAKKEWLKKYHFDYDGLHIVKYGTPKSKCTKNLKGYQILIDDELKNRLAWRNGGTIDASQDIIKELRVLGEKEKYEREVNK